MSKGLSEVCALCCGGPLVYDVLVIRQQQQTAQRRQLLLQAYSVARHRHCCWHGTSHAATVASMPQANIVAVSLDDDGNTTLTLDAPLQYVHLAVVMTVDGDPRGHVMDMRAEVAVLSRNVVFQGDVTSADTLCGS